MAESFCLSAADPTASLFQDLPYAANLNREVDLMVSLLQKTNRAFDEKVWRSVRTEIRQPGVVSYELVSVLFSYPPGTPFAPSTAEMVQPDELIFADKRISRRATTNEIPANYVRVLDTRRNSIGVELILLLRVVSLGKPKMSTRCDAHSGSSIGTAGKKSKNSIQRI